MKFHSTPNTPVPRLLILGQKKRKGSLPARRIKSEGRDEETP